MSKNNIVALVYEIFADLPEEYQVYELVDVQYIKEGPNWYLRVFVDKEGGINLDDCVQISKMINQKLDVLDPIEQSYILEVSSPGVERPLKKDADFKRFAGEKVEIKLYAGIDGNKKIEGVLNGLEDGAVVITPFSQKEAMKIKRDNIAHAKLLFTFD